MAAQTVTTRCCIAGGGPAGMMLGFLLARAGVDVVVLEKHGDFLRDFRGDTIHPSTLELMHELGLLDEFLKLPHSRVTTLSGQVGETRVTIADFSHVPTRCKFVALMPQWDFLNFIADHGKAYRTFDLRMKANAVDLIEEGGRVVGVKCETPEGPLDIRADLVVGADGRHSTVREKAGFAVENLGAPMDVFWMRVSRKPDDPAEAFGHMEAGRMFVMLNRGDYWQCAFVIPKGGADVVRAKGIEAFQEAVRELSPWLGERVKELKSWDDVKLLTVAVDRLTQWYKPGLLCIGDAAHAMSPIGGVGVNLAVQDAVAAANILATPLRERRVTLEHLHAVQERRTLPMRVIQKIQVAVQNNIITRVLASTERPQAPFAAKLFNWFPVLRRIPARVLGVGIRPEHIRTPEIRQG
jgi:2-polyprenyl-6-methoxyphenol hydroxylase-like FAD-dependent oxidoreductase